jgi:hypothetical protein
VYVRRAAGVVGLVVVAHPACTLTAPPIEDLIGGAPPTTAAAAGDGGAGQAGSGGASCGNGVVDAAAGEECDGGRDASDRCVDCLVECAASEVEDPSTHHCYELIPASGSCGGAGCATWAAARAACERSGRHLLVLVPDEQGFLAPALGGFVKPAWTAGSDANSPNDGEFYWDGFPALQFWSDNWASGQPDGGNQENCVVVQPDFRFSDETCGGVQTYICEWDPPGTPR